MATNEVFRDADALSLHVGPGVKAGEPVIVGELSGVAETDSGDLIGTAGRSNLNSSNADEYASVRRVGVWHLPVDVAAAADAGDPVYIAADRTLDLVGGAGTAKFGWLKEPVTTTGTAVRCQVILAGQGEVSA